MMLNVAVKLPTATGVHVTLNTQVPAGLMVPAQLSGTANRLALGPVTVLLKVATAEPLLSKLTVCTGDVVLGATALKVRVVAATGVATIVGKFCTDKVAATKPA